MLKRFGTHFRHNVVGYVALFIVLGGSAYALPGGGTIDRNDLGKGVVKTKSLAKNAATGAKVNEGSLNFRCAAGRTEAIGLCWDSAARAADDWTAAFGDCADERGRLPDLTELNAARGVLGTPSVYLWTGARWDSESGQRAALLRMSDSLIDGAAINNDYGYRCAFPLVAR